MNEKRIAGLDTLRILAFLAIFFFHSAPGLIYGYGRVDFFFVLSAFLLTLLTLNELHNTDSFSKINFFWRRALRIFPLYFLVLLALLVILPSVASYLNISISLPENKWMYWLFLANYEHSDTLFALKLLWSVSVQEQFYLLFLFIAFAFKRHLWTFVGLITTIYIVFMLWAESQNMSTYGHTITHFANYAAGIAGAYLYYHKQYSLRLTGLIFITSGISLFFETPVIIYHVQLSVCFITLILLFTKWAPRVEHNPIFKISENLGKYTYGLYIFSGITITIGQKFLSEWNQIIVVLAELALTFILAYLSYHLYEKQFLKLKQYFRKQRNLTSQ
ncbi:acyltransferase family protein [Salinivirga cyanobacteriivorans]|uniref:acyltransferase family protein n=1 Tax=Salinivirga cyanobacteriivorans TaxID=1307839 RepID=UPI0012FDF12C|nr:acyltransferase [Salinivirga cyanobacteriivorans]